MFTNRYNNDQGNRALLTVDGVDCPIYEPQDFNPKEWWSHKFNGPALRYKLGINI
jgi:hypothetical protein